MGGVTGDPSGLGVGNLVTNPTEKKQKPSGRDENPCLTSLWQMLIAVFPAIDADPEFSFGSIHFGAAAHAALMECR